MVLGTGLSVSYYYYCAFQKWCPYTYMNVDHVVGKVQPVGLIQSAAYFCLACKLPILFYIFIQLKKKNNICDIGKLYAIQISGPINEVLLDHSHTCAFTCYLSLPLVLQQQR